MATATAQSERKWTAADVVEHFGPIPLDRIRHDPPPGTATEQDVNTTQEMTRKLSEYFSSGVLAVWYVDAPTRSVTVYSSPYDRVVLTEQQSLEGGSVLPGLKIRLADLFAKLEPSP